MPPKDKQNTLLGLLGNLLGFDVPKSMTSKDLPTGHEAINSLIKKHEYEMSKVLLPAREGEKTIFGTPTKDLTKGDLYSMVPAVGGFAKQIPNVFRGKNLMTGFVKSLQEESASASIMKKNAKDMIKEYKKLGVKKIANPEPATLEASLKNHYMRLDKIEDRLKLLQSYEKAMEQYGKFGAARPGTEDFIQTLIRKLGK